ncbi:MAG: hypothetical protein WC663_00125 [Patescibacteria group bacterium]|jgi:hypothetical protein
MSRITSWKKIAGKITLLSGNDATYFDDLKEVDFIAKIEGNGFVIRFEEGYFVGLQENGQKLTFCANGPSGYFEQDITSQVYDLRRIYNQVIEHLTEL